MKNKPPIISWLLLALTTIIFVYIRLRLLSLPLERDEGEYAYAGQQILHGGVPYRDVYNMKFPGVYYFYALILAVFGNTVTAIRLGALIINLLTAFFLLKAVEKLKNLSTAIFTAASFIILSNAPCFHGLMANTEHFVNLFIAMSAYFLFSWIDSRKRLHLLLTGVMSGFACLMKQHGIYFIIVAIAAILIYIPFKKENLLKITLNILIVSSGFIIVMFLFLTILLTSGTFNEFIFLTIKYGSSYISYATFSHGIGQFFVAIANDVRNNHPIWLLTLTGIIFSYKLLPQKLFRIFIVWLILSIASVFPGYYFRQHYFLLIVPVSAVYAGLLFDYLLSVKNNTYRFLPRLGTSLLFIFALTYILIGERRIFFIKNNTAVLEETYHERSFSNAVIVADSLSKYLPANKHIIVIGSEPEIYFYTNSIAASSYMYMYPLEENHPWRDSMLTEFTHQSIRNKPEVIVVTRQWPWENILQKNILFALMTSYPGYTLKGFCYKTGDHNDKFLWNVAENNMSPDNITWEIYVRKNN